MSENAHNTSENVNKTNENYKNTMNINEEINNTSENENNKSITGITGANYKKEIKTDTDNDDCIKINNDYDDKIAPDGGWGWMVIIGCVTIMMLLPMLAPCFGILYSPLLLSLGASSVSIAWIFNIFMMTWKMTVLVAGPIGNELGHRKVAMSGGLLAALSVMSTAFATTVIQLILCFSVLAGIGSGLCIGFCFPTLAQYFNKRRGMANAFLMAGISFGQLVNAPLIRLLQEQFAYLGATMIVGAIILHVCAAAALLQPVRWHMKKCKVKIHVKNSEKDYKIHNKKNQLPNHEMIPVSNREKNIVQNRVMIPKQDQEQVYTSQNEFKIPLPNQATVPVSNSKRVPVSNEETVLVSTPKTVPISNKKSVPASNKKTIPVSNQETVSVPNQETVLLSNQKTKQVLNKKIELVSNQEIVLVSNKETIPAMSSKEKVLVKNQGTIPVSNQESAMVSNKKPVGLLVTNQETVPMPTQAKLNTSPNEVKVGVSNQEKVHMSQTQSSTTEPKCNPHLVSQSNAPSEQSKVPSIEKSIAPFNSQASYRFVSQSSVPSIEITSSAQQSRCIGLLTRVCLSTLNDLGILKEMPALLIALTGMLSLNSHFNFLAMVPFAMQDAGHSLSEAAWTISASAITNTLARIVVSVLADHPRFPLRFVYMCGAALVTIMMVVWLLVMQSSILGCILVMTIWGGGVGIVMGLHNLSMVKTVGLQNLRALFGANNVLVGLGFVTIGPLVGLVRDISGSYRVGMGILAFTMSLCVFLLAMLPTAILYQNKKNASNQLSTQQSLLV